MTTFLLLRHAAHDTVGERLAGRTPGIRLGEAGRAQARRLGEWLRRAPPDALVTSPRERARETADAVASACRLPAPEVIDGLDEIDFGAWSGQSFEALARDPRWRFWNEARSLAATPAGERVVEVQARALAALAGLQLRWPEGRVALVSHADVIKAIIGHHLGLHADGWWRLEVSPASISRLVVGGGQARLISLNETAD